MGPVISGISTPSCAHMQDKRRNARPLHPGPSSSCTAHGTAAGARGASPTSTPAEPCAVPTDFTGSATLPPDECRHHLAPTSPTWSTSTMGAAGRRGAGRALRAGSYLGHSGREPPSALASIVFLDGFVPENGIGQWTSPRRRRARSGRSASEERHHLPPRPAAFFHVNEKDQAWVDALRTPHPLATMVDKAALTGARAERVPEDLYPGQSSTPTRASMRPMAKLASDRRGAATSCHAATTSWSICRSGWREILEEVRPTDYLTDAEAHEAGRSGVPGREASGGDGLPRQRGSPTLITCSAATR